MEHLVLATRQAIAQGNYTTALFLALNLPDICARLESEDCKTDRNKFIAWVDRYLTKFYTQKIGADLHTHVFLSARDCYALRCALVHEGGTDLIGKSIRETLERIHFTATGDVHCNQINNLLQLDVRRFCEDVCKAVEEWRLNFENEHRDKHHRFASLLRIYDQPHVIPGGMWSSPQHPQP